MYSAIGEENLEALAQASEERYRERREVEIGGTGEKTEEDMFVNEERCERDKVFDENREIEIEDETMEGGF